MRSIESILGPSGYAVLRAYNGKELLERARSAQPDVIILDSRLPDTDGIEVCRRLRDLVSPSTPILVTSSSPPSKPQRLAALQAGAWGCLGHPIDAEELRLQLDAFVRAKLDADHARDEGLLDPDTGLYNMRGLARRAREIGAEAFRRRNALACVVFGVDLAAEGETGDTAALAAAIARVAEGLRAAGRASDVIGRLGRAEFAIIAPGTSASDAVRLAERLAQAVEGNGKPGAEPQGFRLRAGYDGVADLHEAPVEPVDLLVHATAALRQSRANGDGARFRRYEVTPAAN